MQTTEELRLMTQTEYAQYSGLPNSYITEIKQGKHKKKKLIWRPDPKTGKPKIDADATDIVLGKKAAPDFSAKLNKIADSQIDTAITEANANTQFLVFKAQNEKLKYETESGKYLLKSEVEKADFEKARITRDKILAVADRNCDILAIKDNPHEIKIYLREELTRAMNEVINELELLASDDE